MLRSTQSYLPPKSATSSMFSGRGVMQKGRVVHLEANRVSNKGWHCSSNSSQSQEKKDAWNSGELA